MYDLRVPYQRLFKYVSPHIAKLMTERGSVRVGTLKEYRKLEGTEDVRGDAGEGTRILTSEREPTVYEDGSSVHGLLAKRHILVKGAISTNCESAVVLRQQHPDCFVYCVSERFSPQLMEKFGGACVVITNPTLFFQSLHGNFDYHLMVSGFTSRLLVIDRCLYVDRPRPFNDQPAKHPCFVKPIRFRGEAEVRAIWVVSGQDLDSVVIEIPELTGYLHEWQATDES